MQRSEDKSVVEYMKNIQETSVVGPEKSGWRGGGGEKAETRV